MAKNRVCLIVDNPLRDLDGMVLVAWQLARMGVEAWLTPMYDQVFDVRAIEADFVLLNYLRFNNRDHAMAYRRQGIRVGVLDTEGVGGKNPGEFARLIAASGVAGTLDLYCVWGTAQRDALIANNVVLRDRLGLTGCPRYDFCAYPWRNALLPPAETPGYVLVNTNFPLVNPRFSKSAGNEVETAVSAGFSRDFAEAYLRDAHLALKGIVELMDLVLVRWPDQHFVLRPHPFESADYYKPLERHANFAIKQEGTSIQWLGHSKALLHLNCSTAVEAAMLGVPAITPAWLDTPVLHVPGPSSVSQMVGTPQALLGTLGAILEQPKISTAPVLSEGLQTLYHRIDGRAAERVAQAVFSAIEQVPNAAIGPAPGLKSRFIQGLRNLLGFDLAECFSNARQPDSEQARRMGKLFHFEQVQALVTRLQACDPLAPKVSVKSMNDALIRHRRLASQHSILLTRSEG